MYHDLAFCVSQLRCSIQTKGNALVEIHWMPHARTVFANMILANTVFDNMICTNSYVP